MRPVGVAVGVAPGRVPARSDAVISATSLLRFLSVGGFPGACRRLRVADHLLFLLRRGDGELVVEDPGLAAALRLKKWDRSVDHRWRSAEVGLVVGEVALPAVEHIRDETRLAVPAVAGLRLRQRGNEAEVRQSLPERGVLFEV